MRRRVRNTIGKLFVKKKNNNNNKDDNADDDDFHDRVASLHEALRDERWDDFRRCSAPDDEDGVVRALVRSRDQRGDNGPLHFVATRRPAPPPDVLERLVRADPSEIARRNDEGSTPLCLASIRAPDRVVVSMSDACPEAAAVADDGGRFPLHHAVRSRRVRRPLVAERLLVACPDAARARDVHGRDPLRLLCDAWRRGLLILDEEDERGQRRRRSIVSLLREHRCALNDDVNLRFRDTLSLLIASHVRETLAEEEKERTSRGHCSQHLMQKVMSAKGRIVPSVVLVFLLELLSSSIETKFDLSRSDAQGNFLTHLACAMSPIYGD